MTYIDIVESRQKARLVHSGGARDAIYSTAVRKAITPPIFPNTAFATSLKQAGMPQRNSQHDYRHRRLPVRTIHGTKSRLRSVQRENDDGRSLPNRSSAPVCPSHRRDRTRCSIHRPRYRASRQDPPQHGRSNRSHAQATQRRTSPSSSQPTSPQGGKDNDDFRHFADPI